MTNCKWKIKKVRFSLQNLNMFLTYYKKTDSIHCIHNLISLVETFWWVETSLDFLILSATLHSHCNIVCNCISVPSTLVPLSLIFNIMMKYFTVLLTHIAKDFLVEVRMWINKISWQWNSCCSAIFHTT